MSNKMIFYGFNLEQVDVFTIFAVVIYNKT